MNRNLILFYGCFIFFIMRAKAQPVMIVRDQPRIIVSTDIGGDDPDDYQSLIHLLVYADRFSIEGLISSPPGKGRIENIYEVLFAYQKDFRLLKSNADKFPQPVSLFAVTKQGAIDVQQNDIPEALSEGAQWIIQKALENPSAFLYILVWGSLTDVAQAVHYRPDIKKMIRIYSIGSWNTKQDPKSRDYLYKNHPDLWWIENNTTFRGMYVGGYQEGDFSNTGFIEKYVKDFGELGKLFVEKKRDIKMGDTPSVLYFLSGDFTKPGEPSWGGSFVRPNPDKTYWTDDTNISLREINFDGAKTVNRFRQTFLKDWAERMNWLSQSRK